MNFSKKLQMTLSPKFANFVKLQKFQHENLVDFKKMLQNAYLLAKIGADTAENERNFAKYLLNNSKY